MKKTLLASLSLAGFLLSAQTKNSLLDAAFWKKNPDVQTVKAEIERGNSAAAFNENTFDATTLAFINGASNTTIKYLLALEGNEITKITHDARIYLHWAAYSGNAEMVEYLIEKGSDINLEDSHGYTPAPFAAANGQTNIAVYEALFKAGIDPKKKYKDNATLLLMAIPADKDFKTTEYFISQGLSLNDVDANGNTAFNYAARMGNVDLLKTLSKKGIKATDNALIIATLGTRRSTNGIEVYKYLVEEVKLKPTVTSKDGETVLHTLVRKPNQTETVQYFLNKGVDVNKTSTDGSTALMNVASSKETGVAELLLAKTKNINAVNTKGESALTMAVKYGSPEMVNLLINKGADVNVKDKDGNHLGYYLVQSFKPEVASADPFGDDFGKKMKALQDKGLNLGAAQQDGSTLYHLAVSKHDITLLNRLTALKIDLNAKNKESLTALHKAAMLAKDDVVLKHLLTLGAKKEPTTEFGENAYGLAKENEFLSKNKVSIDFLK